jgi:4-hydroxyphenylpyruvate dioxygenase-like putative hemolysin
MELNIPAIKGIGDSLIYFVDRWRGKNGAEPNSIGNIEFTTSTSNRFQAQIRIRSATA